MGRRHAQLTIDVHAADVRGCLAEMQAFARGGLGGQARLRQVLASLFTHFEIPPSMHADLLHRCALRPFYDVVNRRTSFYLRNDPADGAASASMMKKEDALDFYSP